MKKLIPALTLVTLALISQQSLAELAPTWETCRSACVAQTVTAEGRVRVVITRIKPKLHLAKSQRILLVLNDDDTDYYDELPDIQVGYRRPELVDQTADVEDISDEVKIRLLLARRRAMEAYYQNWS
jgi:hypothetical protein